MVLLSFSRDEWDDWTLLSEFLSRTSCGFCQLERFTAAQLRSLCTWSWSYSMFSSHSISPPTLYPTRISIQCPRSQQWLQPKFRGQHISIVSSTGNTPTGQITKDVGKVFQVQTTTDIPIQYPRSRQWLEPKFTGTTYLIHIWHWKHSKGTNHKRCWRSTPASNEHRHSILQKSHSNVQEVNNDFNPSSLRVHISFIFNTGNAPRGKSQKMLEKYSMPKQNYKMHYCVTKLYFIFGNCEEDILKASSKVVMEGKIPHLSLHPLCFPSSCGTHFTWVVNIF